MTCALCGGSNIEKFSEDHFTCRDCGLGYRGKPHSITEHLKFLKNAVILAKLMFPNLTNKELGAKVQSTLHKVEKHPLDKRGYCEYCQRSFTND